MVIGVSDSETGLHLRQVLNTGGESRTVSICFSETIAKAGKAEKESSRRGEGPVTLFESIASRDQVLRVATKVGKSSTAEHGQNQYEDAASDCSASEKSDVEICVSGSSSLPRNSPCASASDHRLRDLGIRRTNSSASDHQQRGEGGETTRSLREERTKSMSDNHQHTRKGGWGCRGSRSGRGGRGGRGGWGDRSDRGGRGGWGDRSDRGGRGGRIGRGGRGGRGSHRSSDDSRGRKRQRSWQSRSSSRQSEDRGRTSSPKRRKLSGERPDSQTRDKLQRGKQQPQLGGRFRHNSLGRQESSKRGHHKPQASPRSWPAGFGGRGGCDVAPGPKASKTTKHEQAADPFVVFGQIVSGRPFEDWNPDDLCLFLAQNQHHLLRALIDPGSETREVTDKLIFLLRTALVDASALCSNSRQQLMEVLKMSAFFESGTILNMVKSLVPTKERHRDEKDTGVMNQLLEVVGAMVSARALATEDTVIFLGSLQAALRAGVTEGQGDDSALPLIHKARNVESRAKALQMTLNRSSDDSLCFDDVTDDSLGPILPDIRDIRIGRRANFQPRNLLDPFPSATEYIRYIFLSFREDFIGPLCQGIRDYIKYASLRMGANERKPRFPNQDVRLYENVHILGTALSCDTGVDVTIRIDSSRIRNFNSRLIYGSLVCLSCDEFRSVVYATVRDSETLRHTGLLNVHIVDIRGINDEDNEDNENIDDDDNFEDQENGELTDNSVESTERDRETTGKKQGGGSGNRNRIGLDGQSSAGSLQGRTFTMLESTAFYTAYVHTLQSLKALHSRVATRQSSLPFCRQLLQMKKTICPPRCHEASEGCVSFRCMMKYAKPTARDSVSEAVFQLPAKRSEDSGEAHAAASSSVDDEEIEGSTPVEGATPASLEHTTQHQVEKTATLDRMRQHILVEERNKLEQAHIQRIQAKDSNTLAVSKSREERERKQRINAKYNNKLVDQPHTWPSAEELGLDDSQYAALRLVLTSEVALIQGPPGTGKTTLGIRIAELLLENENLWRKDDSGLTQETPLLLLSYTNHALDQFLMELLRLPVLSGDPVESVIRIGSRSEHDVLSQHNINRQRQLLSRRRTTELENDRNHLNYLRKSRKELNKRIESCTDGIVDHEFFWRRGMMSDKDYKALGNRTQAYVLPAIVVWLCLNTHDFGRSLDQDDSYVHGNHGDVKSMKRGEQTRRPNESSVTKGVSGDCVPASDERRPRHHGKDPGQMTTGQKDEAEEGQLMDLNDDDEDKDNDCTEKDTDLNPYERELELEEEHRRKLDLDEASDEENDVCSQTDTAFISSSKDDDDHSDSQMDGYAAAPEMAIGKFQDWGEVTWKFPDHMTQQFPREFLENVVLKVQHEVSKDDPMTDAEESNVDDLWRLDVTQRWRLYRLWLQRIIYLLQQQRTREEEVFRRVSKRVEELRSMMDLRIMRKARVVAMTTTGAARCAAVLRELGARVVLVEEAAQVSEAHLLSSLSPRCQHLIMIGDHQQLRPSYTNYDLTVRHHQHHIDISMFERLCRAGVPFQRLSLQHRMRPEISRLLVPTIYSDLKDHHSVLQYPKVEGAKVNVFFLDHDRPEDTPDESRSKRNTHEAKFLASLYLYLRLQGYSEKDITVLALYKDQVLLLRSLIKKVETDPRIPQPPEDLLFEDTMLARAAFGGAFGRPPKPSGARVTAVDNFQGEESRVVLLSLVRSNQQGRIGYLKEANRVCVALSRAKEGLFVIGNCTMLSKKSPLCWKPILEGAKQSGSLGGALPLYCRRHDHVTPVSCDTDIQKLCPNGGCSQICDFRRTCGHTCQEVCHDPELIHDQPCTKPCVRTCPSGHRCGSECGTWPCPPCTAKCEKECASGHACVKTCGERCACDQRCEEKLSCGHRCQSKCGVSCTGLCQELVKIKGPCGHEFQTPCHLQESAQCTVPCSAMLQCQHRCSGKCGACFAGRLHVPCRHSCQRVLVCGHVCSAQCTQSCPPCRKKCSARCVHSSQPLCGEKSCGEPCTQCMEPCAWRCKKKCKNKFRCSKLCSENCDRRRCDNPCRSRHLCETRSCRKAYKCRGLFCESQHPAACPTCNTDILDIFFGTEDEPDARFYRMPDCGCVLEVSGLDHYMDMDSDNVGHKVCPKCKSPIITALRYGNVLKKASGDMEKVKTKLLADPKQLKDEQSRLRDLLVRRMVVDFDTRRFIERSIQKSGTLQQLTIAENQITFLAAITKLRTKLRSDSSLHKLEVASRLERYLDSLRAWTLERRTFFSQQQLTEFQTEQVRADLTLTFCEAASRLDSGCVTATHKDELKVQKNVDRLLYKPEALSQAEEADMCKDIAILRGRVLSGLGVSEEERVMIVKAMGFQKGHWYKCKNGHVYAIGECGGAMQESRCPECGETVGGLQHSLTADNSVATEMDGATHGAWSEQANLANYENLH